MGEEFIQLYDISDEEIKYLLAGQDAFDVLFNLVKNNPGILSKYAKRLGTSLKKNSKLLKMNLPALAFELYKKKDPVFTEKIHSILDRNIRLLKSNIDDLYKGEMTEEDVKNFNCDEILDFLNRYVESVDANSLDLETFFIQCKLCDIIYSEETIKEVKEKWEDRLGIIKDVAEESEVQTEMQPEKKKITKSKKTVSPQEKAAKQKAAEKNKKKEVAIEEENVGELDNNIEEDTTRDTNVKEEIIEKEIKTVTVKEQKMDKHYVGSISIKGNFYNWNPIGQIIGNDFEFFRESDVEALLPKSVKLNINLSYNFWDEQSGKFVSQFHDGQLLIVDYEVDEMEENRDADMNLNPTGYKVPFQEGFKNGKIKLLSEIGFYSVKEKSILLEDIFSKNGVKIADDDLIEGEKILIRIDKDFLAGPYKVEYRPTLNSFVIKTDTVNNKYLLKGYNISDCKKVLFEKVFASNWNEQTEWYYFTIKDENKFVTKDVISNSALLESFGSVIE